ncbi:MAG: response regulator [Candidatus Buchananbacteria bacterium CG10_big_fil_rev_8_21_14_0_10_42_9]|uniref:Response regulator n=1 Tax=Candidatus Buchananbacteria bacterium CG10_big_fil_rev_8_21_14_0_10_42_9 TaxID=1974526 RepID=A0A2H0W293_9BACT|nr:MAG: response regulator [Candidatus Buchananbacteria bacterium CG10_big_fil_rev_8_21_14_0_10_42_9]
MAKKKKILIVEDDKALVELLSQMFGNKTYSVDLALEIKEGFNKAKKSQPNLILLDILLSGENGFDLLKKLKADIQTKDIPVIILSNLGQEREIKKALELGAVDYMVKADFSLDEVCTKIKTVLKDFKC